MGFPPFKKGKGGFPNKGGVAVLPPAIVTVTTNALASGTTNIAYAAQTLNATGGTGPYTWAITAGTLPTGLVLHAATGIIDGTPTQAQNSSFSVTATDSLGHASNPKGLSITIVAPPIDYGRDLGQWAKQPGDQILVLPDSAPGVPYSVVTWDEVLTQHAATGGTYNGWLILYAAHNQGVVLDLHSTAWTIGTHGAIINSHYRIMMIGFKQINGSPQIFNAAELRFAYFVTGYSPYQWWIDYQAAAVALGFSPPAVGSDINNTILDTMTSPFPTGFRVASDIDNTPNVGFYACDIGSATDASGHTGHGDDGLFFSGYTDGQILGCNLTNINSHGMSPGNGSGGFYWHPDALQWESGQRWLIDYCFVGGSIQFEAFFSNLNLFTFGTKTGAVYHLVQGGSPSNGMIYDTKPSNTQRDITNSTVTVNWFNNGQYNGGANPSYNAPFDVFQIGFGNAPTGLTFDKTNNTPASETPVTAGLLPDNPDLAGFKADVNNPANVWRGLYPYASILNYIATLPTPWP